MLGHLADDCGGGAFIVLDTCLCPACECEAGLESVYLMVLVLVYRVFVYDGSLGGNAYCQSAFIYSRRSWDGE